MAKLPTKEQSWKRKMSSPWVRISLHKLLVFVLLIVSGLVMVTFRLHPKQTTTSSTTTNVLPAAVSHPNNQVRQPAQHLYQHQTEGNDVQQQQQQQQEQRRPEQPARTQSLPNSRLKKTDANGKKIVADDHPNRLVDQQRQEQEAQQQRFQNQKASSSSSSSYSRPSDYHPVAGLSCKAHGGPNEDDANDPDARRTVQDMVYWRDIPQDAKWQSPHAPAHGERKKYLTFEPDEGGFNNIRMAFETAVALAVAMGRILVLPPEMKFYLLKGGQTKKAFGFSDFYDLHAIAHEHAMSSSSSTTSNDNNNNQRANSGAAAFQIMSFPEFLEREAMAGTLIDRRNGQPAFPPGNKTDLNGNVPPNFATYGSKAHSEGKSLWSWMREIAHCPRWKYGQCVAAIPRQPGPQAVQELQHETWPQIQQYDQKNREQIESLFHHDRNIVNNEKRENNMVCQKRIRTFDDNPTPVNASTFLRLKEMIATRNQELCVYDEEMQQAQVVHLQGEQQAGYRMLVHFYAFVFFQDWNHDIWMKRFVRDHLRYHDDIQCAAARIVYAIRQTARTVNRKLPKQQQQPMMMMQDSEFQARKSHRRLEAADHEDDNDKADTDENEKDNNDEEAGEEDEKDEKDGGDHDQTDDNGDDVSFHTMHIRRGDFQFKEVRHMTADDIYNENVRKWFTPGKVLYIATDENNSTFFEPLRKHYHLLFFRDFEHLLTGVDPHYYGMIEQLVAAQGDIFVGVFYSTFTGYINRLRGYHSQKHQWPPGYEKGQLRNTYYYVPQSMAVHRQAMWQYRAVEPAYFSREFPVVWRDLDHSISE